MARGPERRGSRVTVTAARAEPEPTPPTSDGVPVLGKTLRVRGLARARVRPARASESCGWCWAGARQCPHLRAGEEELGPEWLRQGLAAQPRSAARCEPGPARWPAPAWSARCRGSHRPPGWRPVALARTSDAVGSPWRWPGLQTQTLLRRRPRRSTRGSPGPARHPTVRPSATGAGIPVAIRSGDPAHQRVARVTTTSPGPSGNNPPARKGGEST